MATNPKTSRTKNEVAKILKYLSINGFAFGPTKYIIRPTTKNLPPLPHIEAKISVPSETSQTPAAIVKILYGIGVRAAPNMARKALFW